MYTIFSGVKSFVKCKKLHIDHCVFRMHYKITFFILVAFCALVGSKQYAGEPIKCSTSTEDYSTIVDIYCFITSTYIVKSALNKKPTDGAPHPGIFHSQDDAKDFRYHYYYQWVGFLLFFQALLFYCPHWLWKHFEGGLLAKLVEKVECDSKDPDVLRLKHRNKIVNTVRNRWGKERLYCVKYFCCEFLCFINVIFQLLFLDRVFNYDFLFFGYDVVSHFVHPTGDLSPLEKMFPRVTSCTYRYYGEAGRVDKISVICVLATNVINEKVFLFLWFWFVFLAFLTVLALVYKIVVFSSKYLRQALLRASFRNVNANQFRLIAQNGDIGDYLLIYLLGQNLEQSLFDDVIVELNSRFDDKFS